MGQSQTPLVPQNIMGRLQFLISLLLPSLALARILPSRNLNYMRGERVKEASSSSEEDSTTMMPIFPPSLGEQEMRFRYALSQILLPPPEENEAMAAHKVNLLDLPAAVQREHDALLRGENVFQPYENLNREMSREDLPELAVSERYSGPNNEDNVDQEDPFYEHGEWREVEEEQLPGLIVAGKYQGPTFVEGEQVPK